tara:strand:- start:179 stop:466 length:288 start_codon:yes stop_codon:yes gene_type:complete
MSIFSLIRNDLSSLSIQTELLELLDWDEEALEVFVQHVSQIINGLMIVQDNYNSQLDSIKKKISDISDDKAAELIIKLIRNHEEEIINFEKEKSN